MKNLGKKFKVLSLFVAMSLLLCSCKNNNVQEENNNIVKLNAIKVNCYDSNNSPINLDNGDYKVLDIRESIGGNNIRVYYNVTLVLEDINGGRYYYDYAVNDGKNSDYINIAKFVSGDLVTYKNGKFYNKVAVLYE